MSRRDTAIVRLIWDTGARLSEIAALNVGDVDLDRATDLCTPLRVATGLPSDRWTGH